MTRHPHSREFAGLFVVSFAVSLGFSSVHPFLPLYVSTLGGGGMMLALVFCGYSLSKMLVMPLIGRWSDCVARKPFILAGLALYLAISGCYLLLPQSLPLIVLLRILQGAAAAMVRTIALAAVGDKAGKDCEGSLMGTFDVSFYAALALGPLLGGFIHDGFGYRGLFVVLSGMCLFSLLLAIRAVPATCPPARRVIAESGKSGPVLHNAILQGLFCYITTRAFGIVLVAVFLPVYLRTELGMSAFQIGIIMSASGALTPLLLRPLGKWSDRADRKGMVLAGGTGCGLLILSIPWVTGFWPLLITVAGIGCFSTVALPASSAILIQEGRPYGLGLTLGIFNAFMNAGFLLAPVAGGILYDTVGLHWVFTVSGLLGIGGVWAFAALSAPRKPHPCMRLEVGSAISCIRWLDRRKISAATQVHCETNSCFSTSPDRLF